MRLPEVVLDDRRFQDLVNEAKQRIVRKCPEWTDHNVSDPGTTLVELFAWMTDMLVYRINRIPDKLHVALLELLGVELEPPIAARCDLRFTLAGPALAPIPFPAETEVGTPLSTGDDPIVFQLCEPFEIPASRPRTYVISRDKAERAIPTQGGIAWPEGMDRLPFGAPPEVGDALYLGFEEPLDRLVMRVEVEGSPARGAGIAPSDPPLAWEVSQSDGTWAEALVLPESDTTGGFNFGSGAVTLQLPPASGPGLVCRREMFWLRCRLTRSTRSGKQGGTYTHAPSISSITAAPVGALLPAEHSSRIGSEPLGYSDGTPGQCFRLRYAPVLDLRSGEHLEVHVPGEPAPQIWHGQDSFAASGGYDRHFILDEGTGEIQFGPAVRGEDGLWRQRGAVPPKGALLTMTGYRYGGGRNGNVSAGTLSVLKSPIAGVAAVENPRAAEDGIDLESLEHARVRAALEIRSRSRAVTASDIEFFAGEASSQVARARCVATDGRPCLYVLPEVTDPYGRLTFDELMPKEGLLRRVSEELDKHRLVGMDIAVAPADLCGVSVDVKLRAVAAADPQRIEKEVVDELNRFLNPLCGGKRGGLGEGWEFGRSLAPGELHGVIHEVSGVEAVVSLSLHKTDLRTGRWTDEPVTDRLEVGEHQTIASGQHVARVVER